MCIRDRIIGSGVSGTASARELSRYEGKICVVEKEEDVCCGTSKANKMCIRDRRYAREGSSPFFRMIKALADARAFFVLNIFFLFQIEEDLLCRFFNTHVTGVQAQIIVGCSLPVTSGIVAVIFLTLLVSLFDPFNSSRFLQRIRMHHTLYFAVHIATYKDMRCV